jgi:hypothetical protein
MPPTRRTRSPPIAAVVFSPVIRTPGNSCFACQAFPAPRRFLSSGPGRVAARLNAPKTKKTGDCDEPHSQSSSIYVCGFKLGERGTSQCSRTPPFIGHARWNAAASSAQGGTSRRHTAPCSAQGDRSVRANAGWDPAAGPAQGGAARWHATPGATQAASSGGLDKRAAGQRAKRLNGARWRGEKPVILLLDLCYDLRQ